MFLYGVRAFDKWDPRRIGFINPDIAKRRGVGGAVRNRILPFDRVEEYINRFTDTQIVNHYYTEVNNDVNG